MVRTNNSETLLETRVAQVNDITLALPSVVEYCLETGSTSCLFAYGRMILLKSGVKELDK